MCSCFTVDTVDSNEAVYRELGTHEEYATASSTTTTNSSVNGARDSDNILDDRSLAPADLTLFDDSGGVSSRNGDAIVTTKVVITSSAPLSSEFIK